MDANGIAAFLAWFCGVIALASWLTRPQSDRSKRRDMSYIAGIWQRDDAPQEKLTLSEPVENKLEGVIVWKRGDGEDTGKWVTCAAYPGINVAIGEEITYFGFDDEGTLWQRISGQMIAWHRAEAVAA